MDAQSNPVAPWGDALLPCPCSNASGGIVAWIEANPWLALALAAGLVWLVAGGGER